jgi:hypothetical protein
VARETIFPWEPVTQSTNKQILVRAKLH